MHPNGIGLNAVAILIDMAKWTWEALMRTETTLKTESLPLRFSPCYKSGGRKSKLLREQQRSHLRPLAYNSWLYIPFIPKGKQYIRLREIMYTFLTQFKNRIR